MPTTSFSSVLRHRKYSRRSESTSVLSTNDVMCRALWRHLSSLPYKLSIFVDVGGWQPCSCGEVFTAGWLDATFICPPKNFYTTSSQSVYEITSMFKFCGEGDTQQKFIRRGSIPRSNPLPFYISFWQKTHSFRFPLIGKWIFLGRQFGILIGLGSRKTPNFLMFTTFLKTMELTTVVWISIPFLTQWTHFTLVLNFCSCKIKPLRVPHDIVWHYVLPYVQLTFEEAWLTQVLVSERLTFWSAQSNSLL